MIKYHIVIIDRNPNRTDFAKTVLDKFRKLKDDSNKVTVYIGCKEPDVVSGRDVTYYWDHLIVKNYMNFIQEHVSDNHVIIFEDFMYKHSDVKKYDIDENFAINNNMKIMYTNRTERADSAPNGIKIAPIIDVNKYVIDL